MPGRPPVILSGPTGRYRSDPEPLKDRQLSISHGLPGITACIYFPDRVQPASRIVKKISFSGHKEKNTLRTYLLVDSFKGISNVLINTTTQRI